MAVFVKFAGFLVDDVELDAAAADLSIINRNPADSEIDVRQASLIALDIASTSGTVTAASVEVYVAVGAAAEVQAYDGGTGFAVGFSGPLSAASDVDANTRRIVIDSTLVPWPSLTDITIRVVAASSAPAAIDVSYTFTIEDRTAPVVTGAVARSKLIARVSFDEDVKQLDAAAADDALNPANYSFASTTLPAVSVTAVSVSTVDASTVDVVIDLEWSFGADYVVTVTGVFDTDGNLIAAPNNTAAFTGFVPDSDATRDFNLWRMIPQTNRDEDHLDELERFIACLQDVTDLKLCEIDAWVNILDVDVASEPFLDAMLCDLGNPFTDFDLDVEGKRRLIRVLVAIYQQKGTGVGIINVIRFFLGIETVITTFAGEGWILGDDELDGSTTTLGPSSQRALYSYDITSAVDLTATEIAQIRRIAEYMHPAHTHLINIIYPSIPAVIDHLELGLSELDVSEWILH